MLLLAFPAVAEHHESGEAEATGAVEGAVPEAQDAIPEGAVPSGRDIYEKVLANRFSAYLEKQRIVSRDRAGNERETLLWVRWKDGRDEAGEPQDGVLSKTLVKYKEPRDVRGAGYLVIQKDEPPHDQFVYLPAARRVKRANLGDTILGTEFALEDVIPREIESSDYRRTGDEEIDGVDCYVVELTPKADTKSGYSRMQVYVEKAHHVAVRTRYWSVDGIEIKEYRAPPTSIEQVDDVWIVREGTMSSLIDSSSSTIYIDEVDPGAAIKDSVFSVRHLQRKSR